MTNAEQRPYRGASLREILAEPNWGRVADPARMAPMANGWLSMRPTPFPLLTALGKGLSIRGYSLMEITRNTEKLPAAKKYVYDRLADGRFHPKVSRICPFAQTVEAYKYLESNAQVGKVVITVP